MAVDLANSSLHRRGFLLGRNSNLISVQRLTVLTLFFGVAALLFTPIVGAAAVWIALLVLAVNSVLHARYLSLYSYDIALVDPGAEFIGIVTEVGSLILLAIALSGSWVLGVEAVCLAVLAYLIALLCPVIKRNALKRSAWKACHRIGLWARLSAITVLAVSVSGAGPWAFDGFQLSGQLYGDILVLLVSLVGISVCGVRALKHTVILSAQDPTPTNRS